MHEESHAPLDEQPVISEEARELLGRRVGNFVISHVLGQGGMGTVFAAEHPALGRQVAIKFLSRSLASVPEMTTRFLDEARVAAGLRHPNVVEILDFGELDKRPYYVMEMLEGEDLAAIMTARQRFDATEVGAYLAQIGAALDAAHAHGVIHRDLKPANVFVLKGESLQTKLLDFGIAKLTDARLAASRTRSGQVMGTPSHMAPEQAMGAVRDICAQTDFYSLGVIMYEMLTGRPMYVHESTMVVMMMHIRDPFEPIRSIAPEVPEGVAQAVEWCLAKLPAQRPGSARELVEAFQTALMNSTTVNVAALLPGVGPSNDGRQLPPRAADGPPAQEPAAAPAPHPHAHDATLASATAVVPEPPSAVARDAAQATLTAPKVVSEAERRAETVFSQADRAKLDRLIVRMQGQGDFPAFMKNVTEISRKANAASELSAAQLAEAILKDYALTAKLLRVVNSSHYERLGKKVCTVSRAVVVLGFEKVRSIALTIALHNKASKGKVQDLGELSVQALISGEIARKLAPQLGLADPEEAQICAMFRNVGQQLVVHYLPGDYEKIRAVMRTTGVSLDAASSQVLGISLRKLGIGVARRWQMSEQLVNSMLAPLTTKPMSHDDKLCVLSAFSGDMCDLVATTPAPEISRAWAQLVTRYAVTLPIPTSALPGLLGAVQKSFTDRYALLLNLNPADSEFCRRASAVSGREPDGSEPKPLEQTAAPSSSRHTAAGDAALEAGQLERQLDEIEASLLVPHHAEGVLRWALEAFAKSFGLHRALVLVPASERGMLKVLSGWGEDAKLLEEELRIPMGSARAGDLFSIAHRTAKDTVVEDAFSAANVNRIPRVYYESIGSRSFVLYPCGNDRLLFADADTPAALPRADCTAQMARLRQIVGRSECSHVQSGRIKDVVPRRRL